MGLGTKKSVSLIKRACDFCRYRKIKCDGEQACGQCLRLNRGQCTYNTPALKRGPKRLRNFIEHTALAYAGLHHVHSTNSNNNTLPKNYSLHTETTSTMVKDEKQVQTEPNSFTDWPISEQGFDYVKLADFLNNLPEIRLEVDQVTSIVSYFMNLHRCAPILDPNCFLYHLKKSYNPKQKVLIDNIIALQCLSEIDFPLTAYVFQENWKNSKTPIVYGGNSPTFYSALYVLDMTISQLASTLLCSLNTGNIKHFNSTFATHK